MASESAISADVRLALGRNKCRLFRNSTGVAWLGPYRVLPNGDVLIHGARRVTYGLCPGSADLVGWRTLTVQPEMVGQSVAQFLSVEIKKTGGRIAENQKIWSNVVNGAGGKAGIARSVDEAEAIALGNDLHRLCGDWI